MAAQYTFEDTAYVELIGTLFGNVVQNTLYIKNGTFWTDVTLTQLAVAVEGWWMSEMRPYISESYTLDTIRARNMGEVDSYVIEHNVGEDGLVSISAALPANVALVIKFGSGYAGRAKRGRNFITGVTEDQVTGNTFGTPTVDAIRGAYETLNAEIQLVSPFWQHVIASRAGLPDTGGEGDTYVVTNYSSDGKVHTQRRRLT